MAEIAMERKSPLREKLDVLLNNWSVDSRKLVPDVPIVRGMKPTEINRLLTGYDTIDLLMAEYDLNPDIKKDPDYSQDRVHRAATNCYEDLSRRFVEHNERAIAAGIIKEELDSL